MFSLSPLSSTFRPVRLSDWMDDFFTHESFKIDVKKTDNGYMLEAELPGFDKDDIKISYEKDTLTIEGIHQENKDESSDHYVHQERTQMRMKRSIILPDVDDASIKAKLTKGILTVELPVITPKSSNILIEVE